MPALQQFTLSEKSSQYKNNCAANILQFAAISK